MLDTPLYDYYDIRSDSAAIYYHRNDTGLLPQSKRIPNKVEYQVKTASGLNELPSVEIMPAC